jgi:hypothetical protein
LHWALQQTPSTQKPLVHCDAVVHVLPRAAFGAQVPPAAQ